MIVSADQAKPGSKFNLPLKEPVFRFHYKLLIFCLKQNKQKPSLSEWTNFVAFCMENLNLKGEKNTKTTSSRLKRKIRMFNDHDYDDDPAACHDDPCDP